MSQILIISYVIVIKHTGFSCSHRVNADRKLESIFIEIASVI